MFYWFKLFLLSVPRHCSLRGYLLKATYPDQPHNLHRYIRDTLSRTLTRILMYVTWPRRYGGYRPHMMPPPHHPQQPQGLSLGNYHIHNGRGSGIVQDIRVVQIGSFEKLFCQRPRSPTRTIIERGWDSPWCAQRQLRWRMAAHMGE